MRRKLEENSVQTHIFSFLLFSFLLLFCPCLFLQSLNTHLIDDGAAYDLKNPLYIHFPTVQNRFLWTPFLSLLLSFSYL